MIAGIVLAAGISSRLGGRLKQLLPLQGRPITQHVIDAAVDAGLEDVVVVLGHKAEEVRAGLELRSPARAVLNPNFSTGQSSSLKVGLRSLADDMRAAVILLGDQPGIRSDAIAAVVEHYERTGGPIVRAAYSGKPGHPVLFDRSLWAELEEITGDRGARDVLDAHPDRIIQAPLEGKPPLDVDTSGDYQRLISQIDE